MSAMAAVQRDARPSPSNASSSIQVLPSGGACGAEVRGVDASKTLAPQVVKAVRDALVEHSVVYLRDQDITDEQLVAFGRNFGDLHAYQVTEYEKPAHLPPEVEMVSNIYIDGKQQGALGAGEARWHTDMSMFEFPSSFTFLFGEIVPESGGNTRFSSMYRAWDTLPDDLKRKVRGTYSIHDVAFMADGRVRPPYTAEDVKDRTQSPGGRHPVVRTHPESGREALYLGRIGFGYIFPYSVEESDTLLAQLWAHMTKPEFIWEHVWRKGDILIWDNRALSHARDALDPTRPRQMHRITAKGERPFWLGNPRLKSHAY